MRSRRKDMRTTIHRGSGGGIGGSGRGAASAAIPRDDSVSTAPDTMASVPRPRPGVFNYLDSDFSNKHIRYVNPRKEASKQQFNEEAAAMAQRRLGMADRAAPASTLVEMNRRELKNLKRFIKSEATQTELRAGRPVEYDITQGDDAREASKAITIGPSGAKEYKGPRFKLLRFSSTKGGPYNGYTIPDHYVGIEGTSAPLTMSSRLSFPDTDDA